VVGGWLLWGGGLCVGGGGGGGGGGGVVGVGVWGWWGGDFKGLELKKRETSYHEAVKCSCVPKKIPKNETEETSFYPESGPERTPRRSVQPS